MSTHDMLVHQARFLRESAARRGRMVQCNRIIDIKQVEDMVVTHSDCADVFVWDFAKQAPFQSQSAKVSARTA